MKRGISMGSSRNNNSSCLSRGEETNTSKHTLASNNAADTGLSACVVCRLSSGLLLAGRRKREWMTDGAVLKADYLLTLVWQLLALAVDGSPSSVMTMRLGSCR